MWKIHVLTRPAWESCEQKVRTLGGRFLFNITNFKRICGNIKITKTRRVFSSFYYGKLPDFSFTLSDGDFTICQSWGCLRITTPLSGNKRVLRAKNFHRKQKKKMFQVSTKFQDVCKHNFYYYYMNRKLHFLKHYRLKLYSLFKCFQLLKFHLVLLAVATFCSYNKMLL